MMLARIFAVWLVGVVCVVFLSSPVVAQDAVPCYCADSNQEANQRILEVLRGPLPEAGLDYIETPLEEVVAHLRDEYEIEIQIDHQALTDLGIDPIHPLTVSVRNISLRAALGLILKSFDLTYVVADEVLLITTQEEAHARLTICVYPVLDLVDPSYKPTEADKKLKVPVELMPLVNTLQTTVAHGIWTANGDAASVSGMRPGQLVISQTQAVHEEIRNTLAAIRRGKQFTQKHQSAPAQAGRMGAEGGYSGYGGEMGRGGYGGGGGRGGGGEFGGRAEPPKKAKAEDDLFGPPPCSAPRPSRPKKAKGEDLFAE